MGTILRVGLTGNIGAGKSTVGGLLDGPQFLVLDADRLGHGLLEQDEVRTEIVDRLGTDILDAAGRLTRGALARRIFADDGARTQLESVLHPRIRAEEERRVAAWGVAAGIAVTEAALLVETGGHRRYQRLVVVTAPDEIRLERLVRRGMESGDARKRMRAQMPQESKLECADYAVDNGGTLEQTTGQVATLRAALLEDLDALVAGAKLASRRG